MTEPADNPTDPFKKASHEASKVMVEFHQQNSAKNNRGDLGVFALLKTFTILTSIAIAPAAYASPVDLIEDNIGDETAPTYKVYSQCNGAIRFAIDLKDPKLSSAPDTAPKKNTDENSSLFAMSDYFGEALTAALIANGENPEQANYQAGMQTIYHLQLYQFAYSGVMENTDDPWAQDSPFRIKFQSHMDACADIYSNRN